MDDIENDAILLLSLLDESVFPHFLEWNKDQKDLSKWILFLLQTDFLRFKGLMHGKEEHARLAHFAYHIKHANQRYPLLTDKEITTLDRLCNSKIPFKVALAPICQHIWRTVMIRTRQLASSKYWQVMHNKIVTDPEAVTLDFVLGNEMYRRYFDRFLQVDPAELGALQCLMNARRLLLRVERYITHQPILDPNMNKKLEDGNNRTSSIFTWKASMKAMSGAYPYFSTSNAPSVTATLLGKKAEESTGINGTTGSFITSSTGNSGKDIHHPHLVVFTDNLEAFKVLLFGLRSLQREFFPSTTSSSSSSSNAAANTHRSSMTNMNTSSSMHSSNHRATAGRTKFQTTAGMVNNLSAASIEVLNICAGLSDTSRVEIMAVLAQHTAIKAMSEVDSLDARFATGAVKTIYELILQLERELYHFLQQKFLLFVQSQEFMKLTAFLHCEKNPQVWKYLDRMNFLEGKVHREQLLHWASSEAAGVLYLPISKIPSSQQQQGQQQGAENGEDDYYVDIFNSANDQHNAPSAITGKKKHRVKVNFFQGIEVEEKGKAATPPPPTSSSTSATQSKANNTKVGNDAAAIHPLDMGDNYALDAPPVFALHFSACLPEYTAMNQDSLLVVPHRLRLWAGERALLPAMKKYRVTDATFAAQLSPKGSNTRAKKTSTNSAVNSNNSSTTSSNTNTKKRHFFAEEEDDLDAKKVEGNGDSYQSPAPSSSSSSKKSSPSKFTRSAIIRELSEQDRVSSSSSSSLHDEKDNSHDKNNHAKPGVTFANVISPKHRSKPSKDIEKSLSVDSNASSMYSSGEEIVVGYEGEDLIVTPAENDPESDEDEDFLNDVEGDNSSDSNSDSSQLSDNEVDGNKDKNDKSKEGEEEDDDLGELLGAEEVDEHGLPLDLDQIFSEPSPADEKKKKEEDKAKEHAAKSMDRKRMVLLELQADRIDRSIRTKMQTAQQFVYNHSVSADPQHQFEHANFQGLTPSQSVMSSPSDFLSSPSSSTHYHHHHHHHQDNHSHHPSHLFHSERGSGGSTIPHAQIGSLTMILLNQLWRCNLQQDTDLEIEQDNHHFVLLKSMELQVLYQHLFGTKPCTRHSLGQLFLSVNTRLVHSNPELRTCLGTIQPQSLLEGNFPHLSRGKYRKVVHVSLVYAPASAFAPARLTSKDGQIASAKPYRSIYQFMQHTVLGMQAYSHLPLRRMDAITGALTPTSQMPSTTPAAAAAAVHPSTTSYLNNSSDNGRIAPFSPEQQRPSAFLFQSPPVTNRKNTDTSATNNTHSIHPPNSSKGKSNAVVASLLDGLIVLKAHKLIVHDDHSSHYHQAVQEIAEKLPPALCATNSSGTTTANHNNTSSNKTTSTMTTGANNHNASPSKAQQKSVGTVDKLVVVQEEESLYDVYLRYPLLEEASPAAAAAVVENNEGIQQQPSPATLMVAATTSKNTHLNDHHHHSKNIASFSPPKVSPVAANQSHSHHNHHSSHHLSSNSTTSTTLKHKDSRRHLHDHDDDVDDDDDAPHPHSSAYSRSHQTDEEEGAANRDQHQDKNTKNTTHTNGEWTMEEKMLSVTRHCGICDFSMAGVLTAIGVRLWLQIVMLILTDRKVLLVSSSPTLLSKVYFMLHRLIWPFKITTNDTSSVTNHGSDHKRYSTGYDSDENDHPNSVNAKFPDHYPTANTPFQALSDPALQSYYAFVLNYKAHDPFFTYVHTAEELFDYFGILPHDAFSASHPSLFYLQKQRTMSSSVPSTPLAMSLDPQHQHHHHHHHHHHGNTTQQSLGHHVTSVKPFQQSQPGHDSNYYNSDTHSNGNGELFSSQSTPPPNSTSNTSNKAQRLLTGIVNTNASSTVVSPDGTPAAVEELSSWHARATAAMLMSPTSLSTSAGSAPSSPHPTSSSSSQQQQQQQQFLQNTQNTAAATATNTPHDGNTIYNNHSQSPSNNASTTTVQAATSPSVFSRIVCVDVRAYRQAQRMMASAQSIQLPFEFPVDYDDHMYTVFDLDTAQQISQTGFLRRDSSSRNSQPTNNTNNSNNNTGANNGSNEGSGTPVPSFNGTCDFSLLDLRNPLLFRTANFPAFRELYTNIHTSTLDLFHAIIAAQLLTKPPPASSLISSHTSNRNATTTTTTADETTNVSGSSSHHYSSSSSSTSASSSTVSTTAPPPPPAAATTNASESEKGSNETKSPRVQKRQPSTVSFASTTEMRRENSSGNSSNSSASSSGGNKVSKKGGKASAAAAAVASSSSLFGRVGFRSEEYHHSPCISLRSSHQYLKKNTASSSAKKGHYHGRNIEDDDDDDDEDYEEENVHKILTTDDIHLFKHTDSVASIASVLTGAHLSRKTTTMGLPGTTPIRSHNSSYNNNNNNNSHIGHTNGIVQQPYAKTASGRLLHPQDNGGLWSSFNQSQRILWHLSQQKPFQSPSSSASMTPSRLHTMYNHDSAADHGDKDAATNYSSTSTASPDVSLLLARFHEQCVIETAAIRASNVHIEHSFHNFWMVLLLQAIPEALQYDPHAEVLGCDMQALLAQLLTKNHGEWRPPHHHSHHHHHHHHGHSHTNTTNSMYMASDINNNGNTTTHTNNSSGSSPVQQQGPQKPWNLMINGYSAEDIQQMSFEDFLTLYNDHTATAGVSLAHAWYAECLAGLSSAFVDLIQRHGRILMNHAY